MTVSIFVFEREELINFLINKMGLSQSNHRLLGGTKSSLSTTFTPCLIGGARRPLTKEQRKEYNRRRQERRRKMTPEQRENMYRKQRERRANMTEEQRKEYNRKKQARMQKLRARMTEEQRKEYNRKAREYMRKRAARMRRERIPLAVDEMDLGDLDNLLNKVRALDEMDLPDIGDLDELLAQEVDQEVDQEVAQEVPLAELDNFRIMELNELLDLL